MTEITINETVTPFTNFMGFGIAEHPVFGDEVPLVAISKDGRTFCTGGFDVYDARYAIDDQCNRFY